MQYLKLKIESVVSYNGYILNAHGRRDNCGVDLLIDRGRLLSVLLLIIIKPPSC